MTDTEYLERRLHIAENALQMMMEVVMQQLPLHAFRSINGIGQAWNEARDKLDNERKL